MLVRKVAVRGSPSGPANGTAMCFETGAAELDWMNRVIAVGVGQRPPSGPVYDVYAVR